MLQIHELLAKAMEARASDIHIVTGHYPTMRVHTTLTPIEGYEVLTPEVVEGLVKELLGEERFARLQSKRDHDFAVRSPGVGRFRVNAHYQRETLSIAFRSITDIVPPMDALHLPIAVKQFVDLPRGLVLVTGATGSGKSTTLASLINAMNQKLNRHIITLEDPIEYELKSKTCLIEQREVGADVPNFASGLRHALRQDPDVILVGEMRDLETTSAAITAAETGHLVLSTLHTQSASQTLARIIDIYPAEQQNQVRSMLSNTLQAVMTQTLFRRKDQPGMVPGCEVMICNAAVRNCIRENRIHEIPNIIETNRANGMNLMDDSIKSLMLNGMIGEEDAFAKANNPSNLRRLVGM